jgi:hypothetical protein
VQPIQKLIGSMGIALEGHQIWGCERANARSHPQIWEFTTEIPKEPINPWVFILARKRVKIKTRIIFFGKNPGILKDL